MLTHIQRACCTFDLVLDLLRQRPAVLEIALNHSLDHRRTRGALSLPFSGMSRTASIRTVFRNALVDLRETPTISRRTCSYGIVSTARTAFPERSATRLDSAPGPGNHAGRKRTDVQEVSTAGL